MQRNFQKTLLVLLMIFFLGFSYLLSASSIPATRTQNLKGEELEDTSALPSLAKVEHVLNGEEVMLADDFIERRMDLETQDYDGTGANGDHEPKPPRRV